MPTRLAVAHSGIDELLVGHLYLAPGDEVAELGCGSGFTLAEAAAAAAPDVRVVGLDRDREALQIARALFAGGSARFQLMKPVSTVPCRWRRSRRTR